MRLLEEEPEISIMASSTDVKYKVDGGYIYFDEATRTITSADASVTSVTIPSEINGVAVIEIGEYAFNGCSDLSSLTIENGVKSIGNNAFGACRKLTEVIIPNSVTSLGEYAFSECDALERAYVGNRITCIEEQTFSDCYSLQSVHIPKSVTYIGSDAFAVCDSLIDVYYGGTEGSWEEIWIGSYNSALTNATIHYLGSDTPTESLSTAVIQSVDMIRGEKTYNILTCKQNFEKDSSEEVSIKAVINWGNASQGSYYSRREQTVIWKQRMEILV